MTTLVGVRRALLGGNALRPSFALNFLDLGAGVVDLTAAFSTSTATFVRATVANTWLSTGLIGQVASGSARSTYAQNAGAYQGYLSEQAATQILTLTDVRDMTTANWALGATMTRARTSNGADGVSNKATRLTGGAVLATNTILLTVTAAASSRTYSACIKRVTGSGAIGICQDGVTFTDISGQLNSSNFIQVQLNASQLNAQIGIRISTNGDAIDVDFNQFEAGTDATTPIPDTVATRNGDSLTYAYNANGAGTIVVTYVLNATSTSAGDRYIVMTDDGTANNENLIYAAQSGANSNTATNVGGVSQANITSGSGGTAGVTVKAAYAFDRDNFSSYVNAISMGTDTSGTVPAVTSLHVGRQAGGGSQPNGSVSRVIVYTTPLPGATLKSLTT